jgi:thiamine pyrophosphate-dependent acetolactate synthase large subunit-like protein
MQVLAACDSRLFLAQLLAQADAFRRPPESSIQARIARHWATWNRGLARYLAAFEESKPLHFGCVLQELAGHLEKDAIVLGGVGNHALWARATLPIRDRESYIEETSWGTMGSELGGGIAAKLVYPDRQVVVITGDGSLLMAAPDIVTAVEARANILIVVLNDSRYGIITAIQQRQFQRSFGDEIGVIDFTRLAESIGATGIRVTSPAALPEAVNRALAQSAATPVILDVVCNHTHRWPDWDAILAASLEEEASKQ